MSKGRKFGKREFSRNRERVKKASGSKPKGRDIIRQDEHRKIAPKHPNMGRK